MDQDNQQNQPPFNPNTPISEVLKQEQEGFTPSAPPIAPVQQNSPSPTLSDVVNAMGDRVQSQTSQARQNRIIKTYKSDAEEAVRMQQASVVKIAVAEKKQQIEEQEAPSPIYINDAPPKPKKKFFVPVLVVVILLALGGASIPAVQYFLNQKKAPVSVVSENTIITFDHKDTVTLDKTSHDTLGVALSAVPTNSVNIDYVEIFQKILDANQKVISVKMPTNTFATILGPNMPSSLLRSFDGDYMYGIDGAKHPRTFVLFKTSSYDQTFAGMLKWESRMITDLTPIMGISGRIATSTFVDNVISSKDVRSVSADDGNVYFLYGFIDNQTLLMSTDVNVFKDVTSRYVAGRFVQ